MTGRNKKSNLPRLIEIEEHTAALWERANTITAYSKGNENTYYTDQFDNKFFCKNYPNTDLETAAEWQRRGY